MSKIVFGPITSRRFGQSIGIDLSPDTKQCNFDCVYCELQGAKPVDTIHNPPSVKEVVINIKKALTKYDNIDVITLTANGEPTLYPYMKELIQELHLIKKESKILILSNASTITCKETREILKEIDIVKLSLDCVSQKCFKKIDRPIEGLHVEDIIKGIKKFRKIYNKELVIEILVVKGINDKEKEFEKLGDILKKIKPDRIDIGTIDRPPAYNVKSVSIKRLKELTNILDSLPISLTYQKNYSEEKRDFTKEEILNIIAKRPQSFDDVNVSFSDKSIVHIKELVKKDFLHVRAVAGVNFYSLSK
ncbi:MAG: radical SAM protein, partial [Sulfurospirillum sp.]|nr:radical SAM protein [Sulfurospirillum sp.]